MEGNRGIARNTLFLYMRTAISMLIALYTSRVILGQLGVEDYGIYNAIGGAVAILSSLSATLSGATQRFITYALGTGDRDYLGKIFSAAMAVHAALAALLLLLAESVGLWFLNTRMNIPPDRLAAANIVFQTSVAVFLLDVVTLPYNSATVAYEKFDVYAYIFIGQSVLRLALVSTLCLWKRDALIIYAAMELLVALSTRSGFVVYVKRKLRDCRIVRVGDRSIYRQLFSFVGWNFLGTSSWIVYTQGSNILLNIFHGVRLNAAMGVTSQVQSAVSSFVSNFSMAVNPQITKSYAGGDTGRTRELLDLGSKTASYLFLLIAFPVILNLDYLLQLWLVEVPDYTAGFIRMSLLCSLLAALISPLNCALFATGKIKAYQIFCVAVNAATFVLLYLGFRLDAHPDTIYVLILVQNVLKIVFLLFYLSRRSLIDFRKMGSVYLKDILMCLLVVVCVLAKSAFGRETDLLRFVLESVLSIALMAALIWTVGLQKDERKALAGAVRKRLG